jgi:hypothetical protein
MTTVCASRTRAKPGPSPRGETSVRPEAPEVPTRTNGAWAMKVLQWASSADSS